jgi:hypothetical protein
MVRTTGTGARLLAGLLGLTLLAAPLAVVLALAATSQPPPITGGGCRLTGTTTTSAASATSSHPGTGLELDQEQVTNARIVVSLAQALGLPDKAAVIGLATALQESGLRALTQAESDRDSAGIFQQRPSMGWGSTGQVMDPVYAAQTFYEHLVRVPGWQELPLTTAAQAVQRSAYPDAYAAWEPQAIRLYTAITGTGPARIACTPDPVPVVHTGHPDTAAGWPPERMGPDGLTPRTRYLRDLITSGFGETHLGGWCPGGCATGHVTGSDHYSGQAIDIMIQPQTDPQRIRDGDRLAGWLVANAGQLAVKYVIWRAQIWTPSQGWHPYTHPSDSTNPTLAHMDHVHASVY